MTQKETRHAAGRERASNLSLWSADGSEGTTSARALQASRFLRRFSVSRELAYALAELAFTTRETAR